MQTVSHFEILGIAGSGGMGVVYKARDVSLQRLVALKVLPPETGADTARRQRFLHEARSASSLNHPNIVTIYEVVRSGEADYIAMELVEGKTLREKIGRRGLRAREALPIAVQIADAVAAAHAAGIIHRDLKPANVMVTHAGVVKVLDFGLAKLSRPRAWSDTAVTQSVCATAAGAAAAPDPAYARLLLTTPGAIAGTVAYMSPEQAAGREVDSRSDIFSFGAVLYELMTGVRPFQRDSAEAILTAIQSEDPVPPSHIRREIPAPLDRLILRCLRKDPERRWQHMADLKIALEEVQQASAQDAAPVDAGLHERKRSPARRAMLWAAALVILLAAAAAAWRLRVAAREQPAETVVVPLATYPGIQDSAALSPDGNQVAFMWTGRQKDNVAIYLKMIGLGEPVQLTHGKASDISPAWSPDSRMIAFGRVLSRSRYAVMVVPAIGGGIERTVTEASLPTQLFPGPYIAWTPDGGSLAVVDRDSPADPFALWLVSVRTGEKRRLTSPKPHTEGDTSPAFSPDGRSLAFSRRIYGAASEDLYLARVGSSFSPQGEPVRLTAGFTTAATPVWTPDGREIIFGSDRMGHSQLWRMAPNPSDAPRLLPFSDDAGSPAMSRGKRRLAFTRARTDVNVWRLELTGPGRKPGTTTSLMSNSTRVDFNPQFSPDGSRIAFASDRNGRYEIVVCESDGSNANTITSLEAHMTGTPRWSPDGRWIAFDSNLSGDYEIYVVSATGGSPRVLQTDPGHNAVPSWSHDGKWIYFHSNRTGSFQEWKIPSAGGTAVQLTTGGAYVGLESPDGKFVYYTKTDGLTTLWRVLVNGGAEEEVAGPVANRAFAVTDAGIYYLSPPVRRSPGLGFFGFATTQPRPSPTAPGSPAVSLDFYSFGTGGTSAVAPISKPVTNGLSVSPDGRWILYSQIDDYSSDLMMVDDFR